MVSVDIKSLLNRLNHFCTRSLEAAAGLCISRTHYEVAVEHFLTKLLEDGQCDISLILRHYGLDNGRINQMIERTLEDFKTGNAGRPVFSPLLLEWIQDAWLIASVDLEESAIRSGALLLALLRYPERFASGNYIEYLRSINREILLKEFWNIVKNSIEQPEIRKKEITEAPKEATALSRFCIDFTEKARQGEIDPVFGRDREIRQIIDILARRRKNNPIIVGEAGVGKTAVVEGLALRIVEGDVPDVLKNVSILGLDMGLLQAGAGIKGEFENRLKSVINEIKSSPKPIILFIDEAHTLIGAGGPTGSDAANLLKPALARGELRTIAATTWSEYKKYFEKDAALARRFQLVKLEEPSVETSILILRGLKPKYESAHGVIIRDDAIIAAAELASRYISGRQLPDKAVDLLDTSAARIKINLTAKPDIIEDKERTIQALEREKKGLERDKLHGIEIDEEYLKTLEERIKTLKQEVENLVKRWQQEKDLAKHIIELRNKIYELQTKDGDKEIENLQKELDQLSKKLQEIQGDSPLIKIEVDPDVVAKVISDWTGIPLGKVLRDEAQTILNLEENLRKRIKGQDHALTIISQVIKAAKAGLTDPRQPLGVFLLVGPSGVGKTETGLAIADLLFGGERFMVTINMSEFQERHTVSRLIGSPPGYVGYGEGGVLTEAVRQRPYSVVLLDEVEKAHLEVMNLFYQVFDKGMLSDGEGRVIDFKNTVIFLTSNLASDIITQLCSNENKPDVETVISAIRPILSHHFKPALLARMTIVPFYPLPPEVMKEIVCLKLNKLAQQMAESHKIKFSYSPEVVEQIASRCTEVETGARNIDHILKGTILPQISKEILQRLSEGKLPSEVYLGLNKDGSFKIDFGG